MAQNYRPYYSGSNLIVNENTKNIQNALYQNLNIFVLNINRLKNKIPDLEFLLHSLNFNPDIIILVETWLNSDEAKFVNIPGYNTSYYCRTNLRGGGIIAFIRDDIEYEVIPVDSKERVEFLLLSIKTYNFKLCAVYKAPLGENNIFFSHLNKILEKYNDVILVGDTNINLLNDSNDSIHYQNVLRSNNSVLLNNIDSFCHTRKHSPTSSISIIDHASSSLLDKFNHKLILGDHHLSDHRFLILSLEAIRQTKQATPTFQKTDFKKVSETLIEAPTDSFDNFHNFIKFQIQQNTSDFVPSTKRDSFGKPWFDSSLNTLKKQRDKFYKLKQKYPDNEYFHENFIALKKSLINAIKISKSRYFSSRISESIANPKKLWSCFSEIISNKTSYSQKPQVTLNDSNSNDSIPNKFNRHFVSVGQQISHSRISNFNNISRKPIRKILNTFKKSNPEDIRKLILSLKNDSSAGEDRLKAPFLKNNIDYFSSILSKFINESIDLGKFPKSLKRAKVIPIFKSGDKRDVFNYRPISILPMFAKVFECFLRDQIFLHLKHNNIISPLQFGFLEGSSTASAAISLTHNIFTNMGNNRKTSCLFLDLHKAFDTLNHTTLKRILNESGIRDDALSLISDYISDRSQFVEVNGDKSNVLSISHGVPQGSIIGPCLFLLYINNLLSLPLHGSLQCYADDTAIVYGEKDYSSLRNKMTEDLIVIDSFLSSINLKLNPSKSKYIIFKQTNINPLNFFNSISFNNKTIYSTNNYDYLGLVIDERLSFSDHINRILKKITPYLGVLSRIRYTLNRENMMKIYYSYIHSHLTYLLPFWSAASKTSLKNLSFFQNKLMRIIKFKPYDFSTQLLYDNSFLSFYQLQKYESILLIYKISNNLIKSPMELNQNIQVTGRQTRSCNDFRLPTTRSGISQKSILYRGLKLFNDLPPTIKNVSNISQFKRLVKKFVFDHFPVKPE